MPTSEEDMEMAYQGTLVQINKDIIRYTLSQIQDLKLEVDNLSDFMKGYYVSKFVTLLSILHKQSGNPPVDNPILFQEYLKKITSSEKLKKLLNELL